MGHSVSRLKQRLQPGGGTAVTEADNQHRLVPYAIAKPLESRHLPEYGEVPCRYPMTETVYSFIEGTQRWHPTPSTDTTRQYPGLIDPVLPYKPGQSFASTQHYIPPPYGLARYSATNNTSTPQPGPGSHFASDGPQYPLALHRLPFPHSDIGHIRSDINGSRINYNLTRYDHGHPEYPLPSLSEQQPFFSQHRSCQHNCRHSIPGYYLMPGYHPADYFLEYPLLPSIQQNGRSNDHNARSPFGSRSYFELPNIPSKVDLPPTQPLFQPSIPTYGKTLISTLTTTRTGPLEPGLRPGSVPSPASEFSWAVYVWNSSNAVELVECLLDTQCQRGNWINENLVHRLQRTDEIDSEFISPEVFDANGAPFRASGRIILVWQCVDDGRYFSCEFFVAPPLADFDILIGAEFIASQKLITVNRHALLTLFEHKKSKTADKRATTAERQKRQEERVALEARRAASRQDQASQQVRTTQQNST